MVTCGGFSNTDENGMGRFYEPTVLANVHEGMRAQMDQTFGPIVGLQSV
jgi:acyl-CoA reductase-like NAD-dependent aldehyde dehydrogenase